MLALNPLCLVWHECLLSLLFSSLILSSALGSEFLAASSSHPLQCLICWSWNTNSVCSKRSVLPILRTPGSCWSASTPIKFNSSEGFSVLLQLARWNCKLVIIIRQLCIRYYELSWNTSIFPALSPLVVEIFVKSLILYNFYYVWNCKFTFYASISIFLKCVLSKCVPMWILVIKTPFGGIRVYYASEYKIPSSLLYGRHI